MRTDTNYQDGMGFYALPTVRKMPHCIHNGVVKGDVRYGLQNWARRTAKSLSKYAVVILFLVSAPFGTERERGEKRETSMHCAESTYS